MRSRHTITAALTAAALSLALGGVAEASSHHAKPVKPKVGIWEASPRSTPPYGLGGWTVVKVHRRFHLQGRADFGGGIYVPYAHKCAGASDPALSKPDYLVSKKATFTIKDKVANTTLKGAPLVEHITWTGKFTKKKAVSGTISIWMTKAPARAGAKPKLVCKDMRRAWSGNPD